MKSLWNSFKVAFAMFSKIPVPPADWSSENMKYMFCWLPLIGTVIGGLTTAAALGGLYLGFDKGFLAAVLVLIPILVTGGIHVDGLLDTADAMSSWQERPRRLEILKDSHAGAFAVITAGIYFLAWYGACMQILEDRSAVCVMGAVFMVSRCLGGLGVITMPKAKEDGTVAEFSRKSGHSAVKATLTILLAALFLLTLWIQPVYGLTVFVCALALYGYYRHMAMKYFGGTTGDLAGFSICLCEIGPVLALAVVSNFI